MAAPSQGPGFKRKIWVLTLAFRIRAWGELGAIRLQVLLFRVL